MTVLVEAVNDYLGLRRSLGYKLAAHHRLLPQFVEFLDQRQETVITTALALEWATQPAGSVVWWHQRLAVVAGFARYLQASDPRHEVPPADLVPAKFRRAIPYLYSESDVTALMAAAGDPLPLKAATYETLIGLLSVTGMRIGEAIGLDRSDVVVPERLLTVRNGKNGRSREVALHPTTVTALDAYTRVRDELCPRPTGPSFLVTSSGRGSRSGTSSTGCAAAAGWTGKPSGASSHTRLPPLLCAAHVAQLVSGRRRHRGTPAAAVHLPRSRPSLRHLPGFRGGPPAAGVRRAAAGRHLGAAPMTALPPLLQGFFTDRLIGQRDASPHTIAAYRDCFRLLLAFVHEHTGKPPSKLLLEDLDAATISAFLAYLEHSRGNSVRTRNARFDRDPLVLRRPGAQDARAGRADRPGALDPEKRFTPPRSTTSPRSRSPCCSAPQTHPSGPADATTCSSARRADRATSQRTRSPLLPRRATRRHRMGQMPRQRPQDEMHAHHPADQSRPPRVVT